jgi:CheY-like chemotaxis protein
MRKVLIVDDELSVCRMIQKTLESTGEYESSFCTTREELVQLARHYRPDVILLDVTMPGLSGPEIVDQIKGDPATNDIPVVYMTEMALEDEVEEGGHKIGGSYFVAKPVQKTDLLCAIEMALA